jgi:hypothetical protein
VNLKTVARYERTLPKLLRLLRGDRVDEACARAGLDKIKDQLK